MISVDEIKRLAISLGVDPPVVDRDYVLGCFLHFLSKQSEAQTSWIFKGGTALRMCYFAGYRFSEDLDFTATQRLATTDIRRIVLEASTALQQGAGIRTDEREIVVEAINDDYGKEAYEAKVYYRGPWNYGGMPAALKIHVSRDESLIFVPNDKFIIHPYSDKDDLPTSSFRVYSLEEILAEKLRAFSGQRKHAIARDIYDIHHISKSNAEIERAIGAFPKKCLVKGIAAEEIDAGNITRRKAEYEDNWRNNLEYLIPTNMKTTFEEAWNTSIELLRKALHK
jgi:predicted nucleotidyltransferase component of viral defense system